MFEPAPDLPRLVSFLRDGHPGWGVLHGDHVAPLPGSLRSALETAGLMAALPHAGAAIPLSEVTLTIPVPNAEKIICVGVNFPDRNAEYKDGQEAPPNPSLFIRFARSFTAHGLPLIRPPESDQLDYEGEIAIVIGTGGRRIAEAQALDHIAGLTLANEGTLRDWVRHAKFNVTQGKNFDRSGAMGPWLVPFRSPAQLEDIALETLVNGTLRQSDRTGRMIFSFRRIIAYVSTFTTLVPGDTILCGTPTGAGARLDPPVWLRPGDVVEVRVEGIGRLVNTIADE
ncbi:2-keto-4-pentenoate hydratase/2-oxohepta-3-ene-1,7-dioic acid hydratase (catechol pathway) [Gemmobacter megaterium]|uniref:2-keto-4-pentenoate hydratase/2-oxohepta-3-ene-1,7-dioic acid hydratase (Catechol pathway) n=1 Tax=Gemmobacter megaterium TaxID=1086013 RepID=A0A1N7M6S9_9RHOB|nr:fumarylacetoacetate hydrolase family protein [Gemmobacter megaterium]GGE08552.1 2-hydroxyhepta-2,4-diene-1,7-dioate isomerase [Gemmobacter megaterium]SIS81826.1 2-keto-4-pentenoate hydratase/2-oxohepta-3-ene-1,7-dioic acid hydratase (catechol pathway) [Gemmobacter megaterium]